MDPKGTPTPPEEQRAVARAAGLISLATLLSRILGLVREMVIGMVFGAGRAADAFVVAFRIPNLLREMLAEGAMSAAFVPVFTEHATRRSREETLELLQATFTVLLLILCVVTLLGVWAAPWLVPLLAPGFVEIPEKFALTVHLTRIMFPFLLFMGLAALSMGVLNALRSFSAPALAPAVLNLCVIAAALWLAPRLEEPIVGLALGQLIGGAMQFAIQLPSLRRNGMLYRLRWALPPGLKRVGRLFFPFALGLSVRQVNLVVSNILASLLPEGSPAYLYYGMRLIHFPLGVFGVALGTAILPVLSAQAARQDGEALRDTFSYGLRLLLTLTLPAMVALMTLSVPMVSLIYQRGAFDAAATLGTAQAVFYYAVGLWAFAGVSVAVRGFYAMQEVWTPVKVAVVAVGVNAAASLLLMGPLAHGGLALGNAAASAVHFLLLLWFLRRQWGRIHGRRLVIATLRVAVACVPLALLGGWASTWPLWLEPGRGLEKLLGFASVAGAGILAYGALLHAMGSPELREIRNLLRRRA